MGVVIAATGEDGRPVLTGGPAAWPGTRRATRTSRDAPLPRRLAGDIRSLLDGPGDAR
jgi:hypothetical protein